MLESNPQSIVANVSGPQKKGGHNLYSIYGSDKNGEFNTVRRYSDFAHLRNTLTSRWPGFYIPSLPQKKFIGNQDSVFLQMRKIGLDHYIENLKKIEKIWYSQEVQLFLHKIGDVEKELQKMKQTNLTEILQRYRKQFPDFFQKEISKDFNNDIIQFGQYLKKAKGLLQNLQKMTEQIFVSRKKYNEKFQNLVQNLLPDYEKNCLEVYTNQSKLQELIFTGAKKQKLINFYEEFKKKSNSILHIFESIKRQKQQILSFEDLLRIKQYYTTQKQKAISKVKDLEIETTKIHGGKQSLISKIKKKSKQQQLKQNQSSISKAQDEQKNLALLCEIIIALLGQTEISKFKLSREKAYYSLLKTFFEHEKYQCQLKRNLWIVILKDNLQKQELDNFFQNSPVKRQQQKSFEPTQVEDFEQQTQQYNNLEQQHEQYPEQLKQTEQEHEQYPQQLKQTEEVETQQTQQIEIVEEKENQAEKEQNTDNYVIQQ